MQFKHCVIGTILIAMASAGSAAASRTQDAHLPEVHHDGIVTYIMGGIGEIEADAIKNAAPDFPLELQFLRKAYPKDEYLSGVRVRIKDAKAKMILNVVTDGPFVLAKLPRGRYTVSAEHNGILDRREVVIADNERRRVVFEWRS